MAEKVLVNLATGLEDPERVTVAFLDFVARARLAGETPLLEWVGDSSALVFSH